MKWVGPRCRKTDSLDEMEKNSWGWSEDRPAENE